MNYETIKNKRRAGNPQDPVTIEELKAALAYEIAAYRDNAIRFALAEGEYKAACKLSPLPTDEARQELDNASRAFNGRKSHVHISKLVYWLHKAEAGHPITANSPIHSPMSCGSTPAYSPDLSDEEDDDSDEAEIGSEDGGDNAGW